MGLFCFPEEKMRRHKSYLPSFRSDLPVAHHIFPILENMWMDTHSVCLYNYCFKCDHCRTNSLMPSHLKHQGGCFRQGEENDEEGQRKSSLGLTVWRQKVMNWFRHRPELPLGCGVNTDTLVNALKKMN